MAINLFHGITGCQTSPALKARVVVTAAACQHYTITPLQFNATMRLCQPSAWTTMHTLYQTVSSRLSHLQAGPAVIPSPTQAQRHGGPPRHTQRILISPHAPRRELVLLRVFANPQKKVQLQLQHVTVAIFSPAQQTTIPAKLVRHSTAASLHTDARAPSSQRMSGSAM